MKLKNQFIIDSIIELVNELEVDLFDLENTKEKRSVSLHLDLSEELFNNFRNDIKIKLI